MAAPVLAFCTVKLALTLLTTPAGQPHHLTAQALVPKHCAGLVRVVLAGTAPRRLPICPIVRRRV